MELFKIESFANTIYKKCDCCGRVKDLYFQSTIYSHEFPDRVIGNQRYCKQCGLNLAKILNLDASAERTTNEFRFNV